MALSWVFPELPFNRERALNLRSHSLLRSRSHPMTGKWKVIEAQGHCLKTTTFKVVSALEYSEGLSEVFLDISPQFLTQTYCLLSHSENPPPKK